ncbi:hypothetical protein [Oscillatoria salina]|nr:hypothetical protein [Oscillatoria salina]
MKVAMAAPKGKARSERSATRIVTQKHEYSSHWARVTAKSLATYGEVL